jgi:hypothetical protein
VSWERGYERGGNIDEEMGVGMGDIVRKFESTPCFD